LSQKRVILAKLFIALGIVFLVVGVLLYFKVPIFKLPGDIIIKKENFAFYFPITSSILISIVLTLIFRILK
jgi:hypothetical protein